MDPLTIILINVAAIIFLAIGYLAGKFAENRRWEGSVDGIRADAIKRSRSVLSGSFSEQLAPYMPGFSHSPTEARFIGKPVDFIIFEGMDGKDIQRVIFVEVKTGKSSLNPVETSLKHAIESGNVSWETYRPPTPPRLD